jgi:hypothetical protein
MGTCRLRDKILTEKHRSYRIAGGWLRVDNPAQKNYLLRNQDWAQHISENSPLTNYTGNRNSNLTRIIIIFQLKKKTKMGHEILLTITRTTTVYRNIVPQ